MSTHQNQRVRQEQQRRQETAGQTGAVEFQSVEEALRADRASHPAPEGLEQRIALSIQAEPGPKKPFWARLFGGG